jgi:hypothetical protein
MYFPVDADLPSMLKLGTLKGVLKLAKVDADDFYRFV